MFFTYRGQQQPFKSSKGANSTYAVQPGWSRPYVGDDMAPPQCKKPNPIKHWRKQLVPNNTTSRAGRQIPFDKPGSTVYLGVTNIDCKCHDDSNVTTIVNNILNNKNNQCIPGVKCNPMLPSSDHRRRGTTAGLQEKKINKTATHPNGQQFCYSSKQYLRKRCRTYDQRLSSGTHVPGKDTEYYANTCEPPCGYNSRNKFIRNPNNKQFGVQGAVDSSSRIQRLKLNTINKAAAGLKNEWGSAAANAAKYTSSGNAPYFIKSKNNICSKSQYHRNGNKTICN